MKHPIQPIPAKRILASCLLIATLLTAGCRKEKTLSPTDLDDNYFIIKDNPDDQVDHAIYQFYENTGIATFYNDTIHRKRIADTAGMPRYAYTKLALGYSLFGTAVFNFKLLPSKENVPALLDLLKNDLLPKLPGDMRLPSFFLIDSFWNNYPLVNIKTADGWSSWQGFNSVAIVVKDVTAMNNDERKVYTALSWPVLLKTK